MALTLHRGAPMHQARPAPHECGPLAAPPVLLRGIAPPPCAPSATQETGNGIRFCVPGVAVSPGTTIPEASIQVEAVPGESAAFPLEA